MLIKFFALTALLAGYSSAMVQSGLFIPDKIVFSEIFPTPITGDRLAYIEIFNPTGTPLDASKFQVCDASMQCTQLTGTFEAGEYYVLCNDISAHMFCRQATMLQLDQIEELFIMSSDDVMGDEVTFPTIPAGKSLTRGGNPNDLLEFLVLNDQTPGAGLLGGTEVTFSPSLAPGADPTSQPVVATESPAPSPAPSGIESTDSPAPSPSPSDMPVPTVTPATPAPVPTLLNECLSPTTNDCDVNADCFDTPGGYQCQCQDGYFGSGLTCSDVNECNSAVNPCGISGVCANVVGGFTCSCAPGFLGTYPRCIDINECNALPCDVNANCANSPPGSFTCTCKTGFAGDGFTCVSISPAPTPLPTPRPTNAAPTHPPTPRPSPTPTRLLVPTRSLMPSITNVPSAVPSVSNEPSGTSSPTPPLSPTRSPKPTDFSTPPTMEPTISNEPSFSGLPSITSQPSDAPSLSQEPSFTQPPSSTPSLSQGPSITSNPSDVPSDSNAPTS